MPPIYRRNSIDDNPEDIEQNRQYFQTKLHESVRKQLKKDDDNDFEVAYFHLLDKPYYSPLEPNTSIEYGYYYPVRLGDSYGLVLESPSPHKKEPQPADFLTEVKAKIQEKLSGKVATLGQTWMIAAYIPNSQEKSQENLEKNCQKLLSSNYV